MSQDIEPKHSLWIYESDYISLISVIQFKKSIAEGFRQFLNEYKQLKEGKKDV